MIPCLKVPLFFVTLIVKLVILLVPCTMAETGADDLWDRLTSPGNIDPGFTPRGFPNCPNLNPEHAFPDTYDRAFEEFTNSQQFSEFRDEMLRMGASSDAIEGITRLYVSALPFLPRMTFDERSCSPKAGTESTTTTTMSPKPACFLCAYETNERCTNEPDLNKCREITNTYLNREYEECAVLGGKCVQRSEKECHNICDTRKITGDAQKCGIFEKSDREGIEKFKAECGKITEAKVFGHGEGECKVTVKLCVSLLRAGANSIEFRRCSEASKIEDLKAELKALQDALKPGDSMVVTMYATVTGCRDDFWFGKKTFVITKSAIVISHEPCKFGSQCFKQQDPNQRYQLCQSELGSNDNNSPTLLCTECGYVGPDNIGRVVPADPKNCCPQGSEEPYCRRDYLDNRPVCCKGPNGLTSVVTGANCRPLGGEIIPANNIKDCQSKSVGCCYKPKSESLSGDVDVSVTAEKDCPPHYGAHFVPIPPDARGDFKAFCEGMLDVSRRVCCDGRWIFERFCSDKNKISSITNEQDCIKNTTVCCNLKIENSNQNVDATTNYDECLQLRGTIKDKRAGACNEVSGIKGTPICCIDSLGPGSRGLTDAVSCIKSGGTPDIKPGQSTNTAASYPKEDCETADRMVCCKGGNSAGGVRGGPVPPTRGTNYNQTDPDYRAALSAEFFQLAQIIETPPPEQPSPPEPPRSWITAGSCISQGGTITMEKKQDCENANIRQ